MRPEQEMLYVHVYGSLSVEHFKFTGYWHG